MAAQYLYGKHPIIELLRVGRRKVRKIYLARRYKDQDLLEALGQLSKNNLEILECPREFLDEKVGEVNHQGIVAEVEGFPYVSLEEILQKHSKNEAAFCLALDQVQDPQNMGSVLRSAFAFGIVDVVILKDRSCEMTAAVAKASAGASEHMSVAKVGNLVQAVKAFQNEGFWSVGLDLNGDAILPSFEFPQKTLAILGSEGKGMRRLTQENCDFRLRIPQKSQFNSLNAGVAASLVFYEWTKGKLD